MHPLDVCICLRMSVSIYGYYGTSLILYKIPFIAVIL
jgi:hypothetical protein